MRHERGNILFLILLAVILFAALSYAVTSSMKGGGNDASGESNKVGAAAIIQQITAVKNAVNRMRMTGNIKLENISFARTLQGYDTTVYSNFAHNANCSTDSCRVFHPAGGGVSPSSLTKWGNMQGTGWQPTYPMPGEFDFYMGQWPGAGTDANDIFMRILVVKSDVCTAIADALNLPGINNAVGSGVGANAPANWDNTTFTFSSPQTMYGRDIVYSTGGSGAGAYCHVYALIAAR